MFLKLYGLNGLKLTTSGAGEAQLALTNVKADALSAVQTGRWTQKCGETIHFVSTCSQFAFQSRDPVFLPFDVGAC